MPSKTLPREACAHCAKNAPIWLVLDPKQHTYVDSEGEPHKQQDAYLLCDACRRNLIRLNRRARTPRKLRFLRWEVDAEAEAG